MQSLTSFNIYTPLFVWFFLVASSFAVFIDQGISFAVTSEIREDPKIAAVNSNDNVPSSTWNSTTSSSSSSKPVLTTAQAGLFASVFLSGFVVGVPLSSMVAPRLGTNRLIHVGLILYVLAIIGSAFAPNFYLLLICRFLVGFSEAGFMPFSVNIIDLMFDHPEFAEVNESETSEIDDENSKLVINNQKESTPVKKTMYLSAYFAALPIGGSIGMSVGGAIGQHMQVGSLPGWRCAFLFADAGLAFVLMLISFGLPHEYDLDQLEKRGHLAKQEQKSSKVIVARRESSTINDEITLLQDNNEQEDAAALASPGAFSVPFFTSLFRLVFHNLDFVLISLGFALFDFLVNIFASFATIMLVQGPYGISSSTEASTILGVSSAVCGLVGTVAGGYIVDRYFQKNGNENDQDPETSHDDSHNSTSNLVFKICVLGIVCSAIAVPLALFAAMATTTLQFLLFFVPSMLLINAPTPGMTVALLEVVDGDMKPYAMSISMEIMVLFGDLAAPLATGFLSNAFGGVCDGILSQEECVSENNFFNYSSTTEAGLNFLTWWYSDDECRWIEASQKSSGALSYCANISQVNRGLFIASAFTFLQIPFWAVVAWRAHGKKLTVFKSKSME